MVFTFKYVFYYNELPRRKQRGINRNFILRSRGWVIESSSACSILKILCINSNIPVSVRILR